LFVLLLIIVLVGGWLAGCASGGGQPHMQAALDELRSARSELDAAMTDKGGHRERAIQLVDEAISEVQAGMEFARTH
jgi:outer membrane murein-binding lipoprotein Lpp